ncbi:MAG: hypothetical protein KC983_07010, partial [Phycisphaerales bacterium]|nr:hypothetical protein [Phycisphaerales bacterium]
FGPCPGCPGDFNHDGVIDGDDEAILLMNFGDCVPVQCIWLTIHDYTSFGANPGQFCACALNVLSPLLYVDEVVICDAATGLPIPGWDFIPNTVVGQQFNLAAGGGNFVGFLSETSANIPPGFDIDIKFKVCAPVATTFEEVRDALQSAGPLVGTDEATMDGMLTGGHQGILPAGPIGQMAPSCPWDCTPVNADGSVGNGVVNIDDLLQVINHFGDPGGPCDIAPLNPNGTVGNGIINIDDLLAVINNFGPCPVDIFAVSPPQYTTGDIVKISGQGFGWDPNDLCVVQRYGNRAVPMRVVSVTDSVICAIAGFIPPDAQPGPIMVQRGTGVLGNFVPVFPDIVQDVPVWTWTGGPQGAAAAPGNIVPIPPDVPSNTEWFPSQLVDGKLCTFISGDWTEFTKIRITVRAHTASSQQDLDGPQVRFIGGGTLQDCAERIKDTIRCAFLQQSGVNVDVQCIDDGTGVIKLVVSVPGEDILWGLLDICVIDCPPPGTVTIDNFFPMTGQTGDIITIMGSGFDPDPDNNCAVVMIGNQCSLPLQVLDVNPEGTMMNVQVGPVIQGAQPGPIMVATGVGAQGTFVPVFPQILVEQPVWIWERTPNGPMDDTTDLPIPNFDPIPPPTEQWLHGEPDPLTGQICLIIPADVAWQPQQKLNITLRMHDHATGQGHDGHFPCIVLDIPPGTSDPLLCADLLCDTIRCAFFQQAGFEFDCFITPMADGSVKITVSLLNGGFINWGNFDVCLLPPPGPVVIDNFFPATGQTGDLITIFGQGFDPDPDNNCAVVMMSPTCSLPLQVIDVNPQGTVMTVQIGAVFQGAQPGPIMVGLGNGAFGTFQPAFPEIIVEQPVWIWERIPFGPMDDTTDLPNPNFDPQPPPTELWIHGEPDPATGQICLIIPPNTPWQPNQKLNITLRMPDHSTGTGHDGWFPCITLAVPAGQADPVFCAQLLCDTIRCAFLQQAGFPFNCQIDPLPDGSVKLTVGIPGGKVDWGNFDVCLLNPDGTGG